MKILHISPFNTAGLPIQFVKAERKLGIASRLITLQRTPYGFEEDICLELPVLKENYLLNFLRKLKNKNEEIKNFENTTLPPVVGKAFRADCMTLSKVEFWPAICCLLGFVELF